MTTEFDKTEEFLNHIEGMDDPDELVEVLKANQDHCEALFEGFSSVEEMLNAEVA